MTAYFLFNLIALSLSALFVWTLYHKYFVPGQFMRYRFRLFALRDELAKLVCEGKLREDSDIYKFHVHCLNNAIKHIETFDIYSLVKWKLDTELDKEFVQDFHRITKKTKKTCPEVIDIMGEYESVILQVLLRNSWTLRNPRVILFGLNALLFVASREFRDHCLNTARELTAVDDITRKRLRSAGIPLTAQI